VLYRRDWHEPLTDRAWDEAWVRDAVGALVADAVAAYDADDFWPAQEWDAWGSTLPLKDVYCGAAGVVWALARLGADFDAAAAAGRVHDRFVAEPTQLEGVELPAQKRSSLFNGETGIAWVRYALAPFDRGAGAEGAYQVQDALQSTMQDLVGIVRSQHEMEQALQDLNTLKQRAEQVGVPGNREYNPGWHTALDLRHLLIVSEAIALSALARKESRGGHFRDDYPEKDPAFATFNHVVRRRDDGTMELARETIAPLPAELAAIIEEMK